MCPFKGTRKQTKSLKWKVKTQNYIERLEALMLELKNPLAGTTTLVWNYWLSCPESTILDKPIDCWLWDSKEKWLVN